MEAAGVLSVAFGLGLLLHASQAAFFTAINGHIKTLFLHRRRLVLLSFLLSVSIFSITQFATLLLLEDASCGVAVRFTLFFDQAARVSALALIIWKVCDEAGARAEAVMWVSVIGLRILMGGIIVGFTGMTFMPVCFPEPIHIVMGIIHTTFDGCVWAVLGCRIVQIWMLFVEQGRRGNGGGKSQGYGLFLIVLGFSGWTIASFPYMMSVGDSIFVRMVPYILTLALSLGVLGCFPSIVFSVPIGKTDGSYKLRQFSSTSPPRRGRSASSPTFNPADMEANKFQTYAVGSFDKNCNGVRNSQMFRSILGAPIVHPGTALPWSLDTDAPDITRPKPAKAPENRRPSGASHAGKASISGPIGPLVRNMSFDRAETTTVGQLQSSNSFGKMKTVDLKTAAEAERQRIDAAFEREQEKKRLGEVAPEVATPSTVRSTSVKRKPVIPQLPSGPAPFRVSAINELRGVRESEYSSPSSLGRSVSAAGAGDSRRTSRRTSSLSDDNTTQYTSRSHAPYILAPGLPRIPQLERLEGGAKVMFVNQIVYDDPALVRSLMGKTDVALTTSRYSRSTGTTVRRSPSSATKQHPGMLTPTGEVDEPIASSNPVLVMDRPRNVKNELERGIFPPNRDSGMVAEMRYKRKHLTVAMGNTSSRATMHPISRHSLQHVVKKRSPKEIIFPIHLSRANSARKPAPPPITIVPAMIFSPQIIQHAPTPDLVDTPENIPSPKRAISEKSEKHMVSKQQDVDEAEDKKIAYETARAWIDSVSGVSGTTRSPYSDGTPVPLLSIAYDPSSGTKLRMNLISLTLSPKTKEDEGEFTDIEIDSGSESGEYEDEDEGSDEQTQSEADEMIMSGGEGYSTEEESYEEDYFTESDEERRYPNDGVVISDVEDGTTYDKIALAERKLNAKMNTLTVPALDDPNHFQIGDRIPTFSKSRRKYGSRRKPPPSPIAFLMRQRHESQIQARLLLFSGGRNVTSLESLMDRLPTKNKRDTQASYMSDGQSSLLARLEAEVGQQENQWMGMRRDLDSKRSSVISSTDSPVRGLVRLSQNLAQRRSLLAKLNSGIDRRLSNAQATSTSVMAQSSLSDVSSGQQQLAEAQMEYLAQAPSFSRKIGESPLRPISILESQHTPISVISESEVDHSEVESPVSLHGDAQRESFYSNDISVVVMEVDEQYEEEDFEDYEVEEYEEEEEEYGEDGIHITVYSPSIESASIQEPPIQVCYSSTTEAFPKSPISLLWNSRTMQEGASETNQLWVYHPLSPETAFVFPPAVDLRPKQRISTAPITKSTSNLWSKPRLSHYAPSTGLWCPKEFRTKSAIIASFPVARRTKNLAKRVTFVEEVVTVEPTGFLGKLKMLWDAPKRSSQSAPKMQLQRVKTKENLFDPIVVKYANKMLPPLPIQKDEVNAQDTARGALWTKGENIAKKYNSAPLWTPALIVPTPEEQVVFVKDTLEIRTKPRTAALPTLESQRLWDTGKPAVSTTLWTKPLDARYLWPTGPSSAPISRDCLWPSAAALPLEIELGPQNSHSYGEIVVLASLESTELWKEVVVELQAEEVVGLWFDKSVRAQDQCVQEPAPTSRFDSLLWPTAVSPPVFYLPGKTPFIRYNRPSATTTLVKLTSHELWKPCTVVAVQGLWSPPAKESALWPQGRRSRTPEVVKSLWPSAVSLPSEVELAPHGSGYYKETVLALLESTELWKAAVIETQIEVAGLWFDKYARAQSQEPMTTPTSGSFLWPTAVSPSVLYLVVETPSIRYSRPSATTSLATLTSYELWNPRAAVAANALWSPPTKKSALWPQGQLSRAAPLVSKSLWPSAGLLPSKIEHILRSSSSYKEAALASLESAELWKAVVVEIKTEVAGLWFDKSVRAQSQRPMTSSSLLWPTAASLPALYPAVETLSIRYSRPSVSTTALAALTSHELWNPRAAVAANTLWSPPTKRSALWPQGQLSRAAPLVSKSLWPAAALLPSEIELGLHGSGSARKTVALSSLESTELWKAVVVEQQVEEVTGLWFDKSAHPQSQSQYIEELVATPKSDSFLWPTAASLPALYLTEDIPPIRHARLANLATLISRELWRPWTAATTTTLWSPLSKKSALWPQGQLSGPASAAPKSLWPSAAPLPFEIELGFRGPSSYRGTAALASLESAELWKVSVVEISEEMTGLWFDKSIHIQPQYTEEPMVITFNSLLWPATASLPAPSLTEETLSVRYTRPATANLATIASCELWKPWTAAAATALWSPPSKKSALWPQGQLSGPASADPKSLWPSAAPLPLEIELGLCGPSSYRGTAALALLKSADLWKVSVVEISEEMTGLWFDKSIHIQPQYTEEPMVITFNSLLWPATASLPAPSLTEETLSVRYTRPATANLATLTSCELWKPWTAAAATALWSPPSKKSALWPQGQLSEPAPAVLKSLWPSATPLPFEIELGFHGPSSYRETAALASLESTELWKTVAIELQPEEATGLWLNKSIYTQSQYIEETMVITSNSLLWPTAASLPAFYLTEDTISIRYNQPATANLVALTSCELWKPWTVSTPAALWSPPSKQSALWPQGQLSRPASAAPKSLWPSATPLPFEIELGLRGPSSYRETAALASLESTELWKTVAIELQPEEATGLWLSKSIHTQSQYIEETIVITSNSLLWPTAASLPAFYLTEDTISIRYNQPATANLVALTSCELWKPWTVATPAALWSPPSKQSALWPQGQLSEPTSAVLMSLWPSAAPLPFEFALRGPGFYRETASLASLESTELWKAVTIELQPEEETGLWFDKSVHFKSQCIEEPVFTPTFDSLLWPATASLPTSYLTEEKVSIRYTRSATANLATPTSCELWKPWTATTPALWSPVKQGALWPQGQLSRVAIGALWPSAAALRLEIEVSTVHSRSPIVTLPGLKSTELWNNCQQRAGENRVPALWTAPECRSGLWPEGKVQEKVIGNLWPAARSMPVEYQTFGEVSVRSKAKPVALAKLKSTGLWMPVRILKTTTSAFVEANIMEEIQKTAITPAIVKVDIMEEIQKTAITPAIVEVDIIEMIQEKQLADSMLWVKKQNAPIAAAGYLWPSATQLPLSFSLPSTTIQSRFTTATLPTLQSRQLWSSKIATQATLWTRSIKKNGLWPHGKSDKAAGSLWPSAPSLAVSDLARPMPVARPRNLAAPAKQIQSLALWSPEPETKARLWAAPAIENGLWPHGRSAVPTNLWPSALSLPTMGRQDVHNFRTETMSLVSLESDRLWCAASKGPVRPQLWIPEVKMTGLWPRGEIKKEVVIMGGLWPSAGVLPKTDVVAIVHARSTPGAVVELESGELWKLCIITPALWIQSATKESGLWPNGIVDTTSSKIDLWCAPDSGAIVRRSNLMLEMGGEERIARKRDMLSAVNAVSGALWEERQMGLELPGWLLRTQDIEVVDSLPIPNLFDTTKSEVEIESQQIIAPVTPSLWARSPPVSDIRLDSALWQSKAANTTSPTEAPRVRLSTRRKTFRPDTSRLLPAAAGKLWSSSLLPEARQRTWRQAPQEGLWNADGTTATLSQINARSQKICLLWGRHSREVFAHLALTSRYSKRKAPPPGSKSATGPLWAPTAPPGVVSGAKFPGFHGLWSPRTLPEIRPTPTHLLLLWQKYDKPQLVTPVAIPASPVPSRSLKLNKRTPPLYLASQQAAGPMWVASKSVRPRELWRPLPKSGTRENLLWSFPVDTTPTLKKSASSSSETKLWSKLDSTPNSFFSTISKQSIRTTRKTENTAIISMEGPLWKSSPVTTPTKPNLWRKKEETMGLWSVNGITMTPPPSPETATYLWGKNPGATAPIFVGLSQESLRSRREFATKSFSAPPDGLWKKQVIEPVIERPSMGLWGTVAEPAQIAVPEVQVKTIQLWQKDNTAAPIFTNIPVESYRFKRDNSTIALPVFKGSMWKKQVALPKKPELWKPAPKTTHLWDSNSGTKSLAQILLEKKANAIKKPLWTKDQASRTTEKTPQRSPLATFRISNNITLPNASGNLWKPKTAKKQIPQLWTPPKPVVKAPKPVGTLLWAKGHTSRTTDAVPERTKVAYRFSDKPLPIMSGSLWKPKSPVKKISLWKRPIRTVATYPRTGVPTPLWSKELASRTTTARPERSTFVPKKKEVSTTLRKATGLLWQPKAATPLKELWKVPTKPVVSKPPQASPLWSKHSASRTTTATPVRTTVPKRLVDSPLSTVSGTLWHQKPAEVSKSLWKRAIKTVATYRRTSSPTLLWSKELASRTTTARPSRGPFVPKPNTKSHILPAATGKLWQPEPATTQPLTLWTHNSTALSSGLWDAEGRTPSLAEIKNRLGTQRDPLWQRRSVLTSKVASTTIKPAAPVHKKLRINSRPNGPADGTLWQPATTTVLADSVTMWLTRSSRSSSIDEAFLSPNLSRASTMSDMSECEDSPPSTGADDFAPGISRIHSTKASISSVAGDLLWQRTVEIAAAEKKKELALWTGEETSVGRSVLVAERPMRIPLQAKGAGELKVFDKSHELWKPSGEMDEKLLYDSSSEEDFHDAESHDTEFDFHDAESQHSEKSQYMDFDYAEGKRQKSTSTEEGLRGVNEPVKPAAVGCLWSRCAT